MYVLVNDVGSLELYAEEADTCYLCSNMDKCPLLASLQNEIVILRYDGLSVEECGMYQELSVERLIGDLS